MGSALLFCAVLALSLFSGSEADPVVLHRLSQTYLPFKTENGAPVFCLGADAAEQLAYDKEAKVVYVSGNKILRVLDLQDPSQPEVLQTVEVPGPITDVAYCGGHLAATIAADPESNPGSLYIFSSYNSEDGLTMKYNITTGALPDATAFAPDCMTVLTANEGEAGMDSAGNFINPEGSVTVVDLEALGNGEDGVKTLGFTFVNEEAEKYLKDGVRWVWKGQTLESGQDDQTFSRDLEPEQVVVTADGKKAYVNLQENNAIAILDLETMSFTSVRGLGMKDFGEEENALDTSGSDGGPILRSWPGLFGLLQPDVITFFNHEGEDYIVTANEGDVKEYVPEDHNITEWLEFEKGVALAENTTGIPEETVAALSDPALLGEMKISVEDGISEVAEDGSKTLDKLVIYGGRSWSIFKSSDMSLVYDSGNDLEQVMAEYFPWTFNADNPDDFCTANPAPSAEDEATFMPEDALLEVIEQAELDLIEYVASPDPELDGLEEPSTALTSSPNSTSDSRSGSRGPEPEAVAIGYVGSRRLSFVTAEKGNTLFVYDITDPTMPVWQSAIYPGAHGATWAELYNRKEIADVDPEGMEFISAEDSPIGKPLLLISGAKSGTVSVFDVMEMEGVEEQCNGTPHIEDTGRSTLVVSRATNC